MGVLVGRTLPVVPAGGPATDAPPPPFARVGIVGLGLMGGSLALALRRTWPSMLVVGVDRNDVLEDAQRRHAIDVAADDLGMLAEVDLVVLAAPVRQNIEVLASLGDILEGPATVTDVGSTKRAFMEAARGLPSYVSVVGGHPLAGAAAAGLAHASPAIFEGRPWLLVDDPHAAEEARAATRQRLERLVTGLGARPRAVTAEEHDLLVAWLSHLPQLVASTLLDVIGAHVGADGLSLAGRGLRDTTRLAASPFGVWGDIVATNRDYIDLALGDLERELGSLRSALDDPAALEAVFTRARAWRGSLD